MYGGYIVGFRLRLYRNSANSHTDLSMIVIWSGANIFYVFIWYHFHPYCLPDPALCSIKHPTAIQLLFSSGMVRSIAEIVYTDEDRNREVFCDKVCDVYSKR